MSISAVVESACDNLAQMALAKQVGLTLFVDPAIATSVLGDPGRLRQILINLINNAIKFSAGQDQPGRVSVRVLQTERTPQHTLLSFRVTDNGIGMEQTTRAKLFNAFTQAETSTTRNFGGTGLGLAISGQLAKLMGGDIGVLSTPGEGSVFSLNLPFALGPEPVVPTAIPNLVTGMPCLVMASADGLADDLAVYLGAEQALVSRAADLSSAQSWMLAHPGGLCIVVETARPDPVLAGLRVAAQAHPDQYWHIANNGQEALTRWQTGAYALLITDLHMPLMDGYELTVAIRAAELGKPRIPIIAFTANALKGEADRCRAIGMDDYLSKPVPLAELKAMLKKWQPVVFSVPFNTPVEVPDPQPLAIDVRVLAALVGDDATVIREFLNDFHTSARQINHQLHTANATGDALAAGALAHQLKSAARSVGAVRLGEICADLARAPGGPDQQTRPLLSPDRETR